MLDFEQQRWSQERLVDMLPQVAERVLCDSNSMTHPKNHAPDHHDVNLVLLH